MSQSAQIQLHQQFPTQILGVHAQHGNETLVCAPDAWLAIATYARDALGFAMLTDLTCVDYLGDEPRFEVVAHIYNLTTKARLRLKARVPEEKPEIASLFPIWPAANWLEREAYDLYGVKFTGHPDLRRILMYDEFVGHPLRKDYPKEKRQPLVRRDAAG